MKFKIPEIKISKLGKKNSGVSEDDDVNVQFAEDEEVPSETEAVSNAPDEYEQPSEVEPASEPGKAHSGGLAISEPQLRMIWAGEIVFALTMVITSVLIALAN